MNYTQTLEFLFSSLPAYETKGLTAYKPGLDRIAAFCRSIGNPQRNFFIIHVAGTNGKGSVSHMIASVLQQAGYRTGLFTSPHLKDFRERIRVDGEMIPKQKVVNFVDKHHDAMVASELTFFEMTAALAFDYFAQSDVEVAVIETGLGGRLDATNIVMPILSVVTNIGLEHTALLGDTLQKIAAEKAGIVKKSIPLLLGEANKAYDEVFEAAAAENKSKLIRAEEAFTCEPKGSSEGRSLFRLRRERDGRVFEAALDLGGSYQRHNIVTAAAAIDFLHEETPLSISRRAFLEGLRDAAANTSLQGRWQTLAREPHIVCDTGTQPPRHRLRGRAAPRSDLRQTLLRGRLRAGQGPGPHPAPAAPRGPLPLHPGAERALAARRTPGRKGRHLRTPRRSDRVGTRGRGTRPHPRYGRRHDLHRRQHLRRGRSIVGITAPRPVLPGLARSCPVLL